MRLRMDGPFLATLGAILVGSLAAEALAARARLPLVTLLLLLGLGLGPLGLDAFPPPVTAAFPELAQVALMLVGFLLGGEMAPDKLGRQGPQVARLAISVCLASAVAVAGGLWLAGVEPVLALLLGAVAPATDPAATLAVTRDVGARGPVARTLLGVVAVDDVIGLVLFAALAAIAGLIGGSGELMPLLAETGWEVLGALVLGAALGVPTAALSGRLSPGQPTRVEALGAVLLCGGLALALHVSYLLATVTMGWVVAVRAKHHARSFRAIEQFEWPLLVLFFVLSGAVLDAPTLRAAAPLTAAYMGLRLFGRIGGAWLGGVGVVEGAWSRARLGLALLPQAGVALGMALVAAERFPEAAAQLMAVTVVATVLFEVVGPVGTAWVLRAEEGRGR